MLARLCCHLCVAVAALSGAVLPPAGMPGTLGSPASQPYSGSLASYYPGGAQQMQPQYGGMGQWAGRPGAPAAGMARDPLNPSLAALLSSAGSPAGAAAAIWSGVRTDATLQEVRFTINYNRP